MCIVFDAVEPLVHFLVYRVYRKRYIPEGGGGKKRDESNVCLYRLDGSK
jgi:hypothetical protein